MKQELLNEEYSRLFLKCELYELKLVLETPSLRWFMCWELEPSTSFLIKDQKGFKEFFGRNYLRQIAGYGFSHVCLASVTVVTHASLSRASAVRDWIEVWRRYKEQRFLQSNTFLKRLYVSLFIQKRKFSLEWSKNGSEILLHDLPGLQREFSCDNLQQIFKFYGFHLSGIRLTHPFLSIKSSIRAWLLVEMMASMNAIEEVNNPKLLGLDTPEIEIMSKETFEKLLRRKGPEEEPRFPYVPATYNPVYSERFFRGYDSPAIRPAKVDPPARSQVLSEKEPPCSVDELRKQCLRDTNRTVAEYASRIKRKRFLRVKQESLAQRPPKPKSHRRPPQFLDLEEDDVQVVDAPDRISQIHDRIRLEKTITIEQDIPERVHEQFMRQSSALFGQKANPGLVAFQQQFNLLTQNLKNQIVGIQSKFQNQTLEILKIISLCNAVMEYQMEKDRKKRKQTAL